VGNICDYRQRQRAYRRTDKQKGLAQMKAGDIGCGKSHLHNKITKAREHANFRFFMYSVTRDGFV